MYGIRHQKWSGWGRKAIRSATQASRRWGRSRRTNRLSRILREIWLPSRRLLFSFAAVRSLQSEGFDFVLLNQGSPKLDWRGVLEQAIAIDRHTPVLVLTRCIDMPSYLDAMHLGAIDYVEEPTTRSEVVRLIEAYLRPQGQA